MGEGLLMGLRVILLYLLLRHRSGSIECRYNEVLT